MKLNLRRITVLIALCSAWMGVAGAETIINGSRSILGNWDASGANTTKSCKTDTVANLPATCGVGECYFATDAAAGNNLYLCTATNTWTQLTASAALTFKTIATSSGTSPVADSSTDTLTMTGTSPITITGDSTADSVTVAIGNAAADGSTKGAASFTANDFDASSGNIAIDYTNGQAASGSTKGFLTSADWTTFNGKVGGVTGDSGGTTTGTTVTITGGVGNVTTRSTNTITVSSTRYTATATATTSLTVTGATHGIGSANLRVTCYDNSSPRKMVEPDSVTIDDTTKDVVITFFAAQTGKCYIE